MSDGIQVPLLDLKAQYASIRTEINDAISRVVESQMFILGPEVVALEKELATYCNVPHAIGCASGSDALLLALMALGVKEGDEVICPSYTFFATAGAIARIGAIPVFADIDPVTYNMCAESTRLAAKNCKRLKAIIPVHLFGQCANMIAFEKLAGELGVPLIEDAAQAIGSQDTRGISAGKMSVVSCFSFFPSKNLGCFGDGGLVCSLDNKIADSLRVLRVHGSQPKYYHKVIGVNSRLDALQAAVLRVKLKRLDEWTMGRQRNAQIYDKLFSTAGAQTSTIPLSNGGIQLRTPQPAEGNSRHIYNQYVIRVPANKRDLLIKQLKEKNIGSEIYYPLPLHRQECFEYLGMKDGTLPESESAARETLALPIYPELNQQQIEHVANSVVQSLG